MKRSHRALHLFALVVSCATVVSLAGCTGPDPMRIHLKKTFEPQGFELADLMRTYEPLVPGKWQLDPIAEHPEGTVCVSQVAGKEGQPGEIPPHYFKRHHRVICVLNGKGIAEVGGTRLRVAPGTTLVVPKGRPYQYTSTSTQRYFAICAFSPRYTGKDIKFIKRKKGK